MPLALGLDYMCIRGGNNERNSGLGNLGGMAGRCSVVR